ncbi:MAG TPA: hypothetical protein VK476_00270 [Flavobacterium sp.]|nr:hypothetical protein [Flavobacterium sp.]
MKKIIIILAALLFALNIQSQNKQVQAEEKTTKVTVKDSEGEKTTVKKENVQQEQKVELQRADARTLNKDIKETPVEVTKSITVTNPDGSTRTVDVDRSGFYTFNGQRYQVALDSRGYKITSNINMKPAILRKTTTNSYIYRSGPQTSMGYFDTNGNLILETYDEKLDKVNSQTYVPAK